MVVHDTVPTEVQPDGGRTAVFRDSTWAGVITGTMMAPPFPAPLGIAYEVHRPAFSPEIAFVRVGDTVAAVVGWQGESVKLSVPAWLAPQEEPPSWFSRTFAAYSSLGYSTIGGGYLAGQVGVSATFGRWTASAAVEQDVPTTGAALSRPGLVGTLTRTF